MLNYNLETSCFLLIIEMTSPYVISTYAHDNHSHCSPQDSFKKPVRHKLYKASSTCEFFVQYASNQSFQKNKKKLRLDLAEVKISESATKPGLYNFFYLDLELSGSDI